jgi:hypothetical protein
MRYVYLLECNGFVKIGSAANPALRRGDLQVGNPYPIKLLWKKSFPDAYLVEEKLHAYFADKGVRGEWFSLGLDPVCQVEKALEILTGESAGSEIVRLWFSLSPAERLTLARRILKLKKT